MLAHVRVAPRLLFAAVAFAALSPLAAPPAAAFTEECPYGVNAHQASDDALDLVAAAGIGWVRFDMNWFQFEPSDNGHDWSIADRFFGHAEALGLHVFVTIAYTPSWAVGVPCNDADPNWENWCHNAPPADPAKWAEFVTAAVDRYGHYVKHWGMWNEPNLGHFFKGTRDEYVDEILIPGSNAVHAACADCLVLGPDLAHLRGAEWDSCEGICVPLMDCECAFNGWNHSLKEVLADGGAYIDIVTHHKYADPADEWWTEALEGEFIVIQIIDGIKEVTDQYAPGKPVWITELGWESEHLGDHSNSYAASQLTALYVGYDDVLHGSYPGVANQPWPELEKLFWYDLVNDDNAMTFGLLESDLDPKAPYTAYADVIQLLGDCVEGDDDDDATGSDDDDTGPGDDDTGADDDDTGADDDDTGPGDDDDTAADDDEAGDDDTGTGDDDDGPQGPGGYSQCSCDASGSRPLAGAALAGALLAIAAIRRRLR